MKWPMRLIEGEAVARFVSDRLGFAVCPPYTTLGIEREGEIVGGVIFNCFEGASVHVTLAGTGWTRGFLRAVGGYVYQHLGRSEEHTSELQSLMRITYTDLCFKQ